MIIEQSNINLTSERSYLQAQHQSESLVVWRRGESGQAGEQARRRAAEQVDPVSLSHRGNRIHHRHLDLSEVELEEEQTLHTDLNIRLLKELFERLTGRRFHLADPVPRQTGGDAPMTAGEPQSQADRQDGFGLIYQYEESTYEREQTSFAASGTINTADGRQIAFSVSLSMSREFASSQKIELRAGEALKDPLVINFNGTTAQLSARDFHFDIDSDGTSDQISFVAPGSGFLALDRNGDGQINNGGELFGALSGDGFADLRAFDLDGNNWIDERDAVYDQLRIWTRDKNGNDRLLALGQAGVGALYLGAVDTLFSMTGSENQLQGQVRQTGLALMEDGRAVTMQQIDLVA